MKIDANDGEKIHERKIHLFPMHSVCSSLPSDEHQSSKGDTTTCPKCVDSFIQYCLLLMERDINLMFKKKKKKQLQLHEIVDIVNAQTREVDIPLSQGSSQCGNTGF